ncbi:MAG: 2-succinyl-5-enolpyruvyl-6-hydroxy-3-cyclohexene-1-carboxylic-acid synthase [Lactococcus hircilactis]
MDLKNEFLAPLVDEFFHLGVREVVFSPGSRSTTLALYFTHYKKYKTFVNIDERSAAFFALGIAKSHKRPVVLVCTSGSAGAHYLPALTEAKHSRIPLIVLTADRPNHLQFVGAPQTVNQTAYFGSFVKHDEQLSTPNKENFWSYPRKVAQRLILSAQNLPKGPVHLNVPVDEPLIPDLNPNYFKKEFFPFQIQKAMLHPSYLPDLSGKIVILAGPDSNLTAQKEMIELAERIKAPLLCDPLSNLRSFESPVIIDAYDAFLVDHTLQEKLQPDLFIQFGQIPVSKRVQQMINNNKQAQYIQVDETLEYRNPLLTTTLMIQSDIKSFCEAIQSFNRNDAFLLLWQEAQEKMRKKLNRVKNENESFEGKYIQLIQEVLNDETQILVSNSMEIRDVDYFWEAKNSSITFFGNRGTNGIDGQESTALGLSTTGKPTLLITGDLSMIHDMNGLLIGKTHELNLTIVLFNNDGGGIFHHLAQKNLPYFDYIFSTPHGVDFSGLKQLFHLDYTLITSDAMFRDQLMKMSKKTGVHLLEVRTNKNLSLLLHEKYTKNEF